MIQDTDEDIVLNKGDETIREYHIARIIYELIREGISYGLSFKI